MTNDGCIFFDLIYRYIIYYGVSILYIEVKLRTGYFKTIQCNMIMSDSKIILSPLSNHTGEHNEEITIDDIDTLAISGIENNNPRIEIQSHNSTYLCTVHESIDLDDLLRTIRKELKINKAIICSPF